MAIEQKARFLRVKVVDHTKPGDPVVTINMPIGVVKWGMNMAQAFSPRIKHANLDWDAVVAMIQEGAQGKIVDVHDEVEHKTIEVWVD